MAVESDRHPVIGARAPRWTGWFGAISLLLVITLLAAVLVQARQYALVSQTVQRQDDYLVLNLYQLETEYLRLREQWQRAAGDPPRARESLQLRYDIFVSRIELLQSGRAARVLAEQPQSSSTLRPLLDFVDRADLYLGQNAYAQFSAVSLQALLAELTSLDEPVHQMLLAGSHRVAEQVSARLDTFAQHNRIALALTGFLSAMVLILGFLALRRMRQLEASAIAMQAMAERLHDARAEALRASQIKSEFLANMSHEIRTPFHGLLGMLSLLQETQLDARQQNYLRTATESADHLLTLLNDILDLSKLESGALALEPHPLDLIALLDELEGPMRAKASAKGLALRVEIAAGLPTPVRLDGSRLRQILINLLSNAVKFTDAGSVTLRCSRTGADDGHGGQLEFEVLDTGIGMDATAVQRLFQRFGPVDTTRARRQGGSGLGLVISRHLALLMGGDIVVHSTPGEGSVFRLRVPCVPATDAQAAANQPTARACTDRPNALRVLVAEDHPVNRLYLAALLERLGHSAHFVENGLEAVQSVNEHAFDIVLMDVHMPVMDGIAATEAIRALAGAAGRVPIVALTADTLADTRERCLVAGMHDVVTKPLGLPELKALLVRHFGAAAGEPGNPSAAPPSTEGSALLDRAVWARLLNLLPRGEAMALYDKLFAQAADASPRLRQALRDADMAELQRVSHGVTGAALNLGLRALADSAAQLHAGAATLNATQLALALQRFDETLAASRELYAAESLQTR